MNCFRGLQIQPGPLFSIFPTPLRTSPDETTYWGSRGPVWDGRRGWSPEPAILEVFGDFRCLFSRFWEGKTRSGPLFSIFPTPLHSSPDETRCPGWFRAVWVASCGWVPDAAILTILTDFASPGTKQNRGKSQMFYKPMVDSDQPYRCLEACQFW